MIMLSNGLLNTCVYSQRLLLLFLEGDSFCSCQWLLYRNKYMVRRMSECSCLKGMIFNIPSMGHNDFKSQRVEDGQSKGISWMQRFHSWRHSSCQYLPAGVTSTRPAQDWDHHKWSIMNGREALEASIPPEGLMSLMMTETKRAIFFGKLPMLPHIHSLLFNYVLAIDRVWKKWKL